MDKKRPIEEITRIAQKLADDLGYELVEAAFEKEPAGNYLRIYLDVDRGITLDDCEKYHMAVMGRLEKYDYDFLEVCSPGVDRPIKTPRDAQKALGKTVEVRLYKPIDGMKTITGNFLGLDEEGYRLNVLGKEMVIAQKDAAVARCVPDMEALAADMETGEEQE